MSDGGGVIMMIMIFIWLFAPQEADKSDCERMHGCTDDQPGAGSRQTFHSNLIK